MAPVPSIASTCRPRGSAPSHRGARTCGSKVVGRLLICSRSHAPHGGADRIIADLCREMPRRGWQVTLGLTQGERFNDVGRYLEVMGADLPAKSIDGRKGTRTARVDSLRRLMREEAPDVVLSMRVFDAYEAACLEKAAGRELRLAVGVRSFEPHYLFDLSMYRESVDLCVTSGELIARLAREHCGLDAARVASIGGGVHAPLVSSVDRSPKRPLELLYAGRLDDGQKRVLDVPPFLDELDRLGVEYRMHFAGIGPAEPALRERLAARTSDGKVLFHGWVSREALYQEHFPRMDCFVHFAAWEGMTIAPREAMAHGVVPVISRFPGWRIEGQFREEDTALTFGVGDTRAAAACIRRLLDEEGLMARLSAQARSSQQGRYSFAGSMDAWAAALDDCIQLPVARGKVPVVPSRTDGRLARLGLSPRLQETLRTLAGRRTHHASPGSEWPTSSGLLGEDARRTLDRLAREMDGEAA